MANGYDMAHRSYVLPPGEGELIAGLRVRIKAGEPETGNAISVQEVDNPGFGGPPLHLHRLHDEILYVVQGEYLFQVSDEVIRAPVGTFAYCPRGVPHTFAASGRMPSRLLNLGLPGGLEQYIRELDRLMAAGADAETLQRHDAAWDTELVGGPIAREAALGVT